MKEFRFPAALCLLFGLSAAAVGAGPAFRLVSFDTSSLPKVFGILDVPVTNAGAPTLTAGDFQLLEDGKATSVASGTLKFRDTNMGLALIVAIDASPSMEGRPMNAIRDGLVQLVSRKRDKDKVTVLTFADDFRWETRWDATPSATQEAFRNLKTRGTATRLYDAVGQAMDEFAAQSRQDSAFPTRMSILVLSDGHDEGSHTSLNRIASRIRGSRVRVDSVGLAHSPLWLDSLRTIANAGFGGFRAASTPEQLTKLLGDGIDALLDTPAVQFEAQNLSNDGKSHQMGIEDLPTHWRDQMAVTLPQASLLSGRRLWIAAAAAAVLLIGVTMYFTRRRAPVPVAASAQAIPAKPQFQRTETQAEPVQDAGVKRAAPRMPTALETSAEASSEPMTMAASAAPARTPTPPAPPAPPTPARQATILAPGESGTAAVTTLVAVAGPVSGQRFPLTADEFWIGSSPNNHLCLGNDPTVSGNHACIRREDRFRRLYDNGSLNNTLVNGRPIGQEVVLLRTRDRIRIGQSEFTLEP